MPVEVCELFLSIQGETSRAGMPCVFVRTTGCNLRCTYCDTQYAYSGGEALEVPEIVNRVHTLAGENIRLVCLTGGEPLLQPQLGALSASLCNAGNTVIIETNGSIPIDRNRDPRAIIIMDVKCPGSGMMHKMDWANLDRLDPRDELKFVLSTREDFDWGAELVLREKLHDRVSAALFSPVHGAIEPSELADWILTAKLPARMQLQLHRLIWGADARGR